MQYRNPNQSIFMQKIMNNVNEEIRKRALHTYGHVRASFDVIERYTDISNQIGETVKGEPRPRITKERVGHDKDIDKKSRETTQTAKRTRDNAKLDVSRLDHTTKPTELTEEDGSQNFISKRLIIVRPTVDGNYHTSIATQGTPYKRGIGNLTVQSIEGNNDITYSNFTEQAYQASELGNIMGSVTSGVYSGNNGHGFNSVVEAIQKDTSTTGNNTKELNESGIRKAQMNMFTILQKHGFKGDLYTSMTKSEFQSFLQNELLPLMSGDQSANSEQWKIAQQTFKYILDTRSPDLVTSPGAPILDSTEIDITTLPEDMQNFSKYTVGENKVPLSNGSIKATNPVDFWQQTYQTQYLPNYNKYGQLINNQNNNSKK